MKHIKQILVVAILFWLACRTEFDFGVCMNNEKDGFCYMQGREYNYISYIDTEAEKGDKVLTVLLLNPYNAEVDDYIYRKDFVLKFLNFGY